ncbi:MAG: folate-binding protein [Proteobacteria bacterium]|nr:folate-binding protein [Pseudomonadota bacterium]
MTPPFRRQPLRSRAVIRLAGENVLHFLHNLLTMDVDHLAPGHLAYGALLSPQGKIQHELFVHNQGDAVFIDCVAGQRDELLRKLMMYRLRAKISIEPAEGLSVVADPERPVDGIAADPRHDGLGARLLTAHAGEPDDGSYRAFGLALGIGDGALDIGQNEFFPHEANLDLLNGVNFRKGCYVGQEVVSRMQHRGTARSRLLPVSCGGPAPPKGTAITSGETLVGTLLSSQDHRAMAVIRLDRLAEVKAPLLSADVSIHVHKPGWMKIDVSIPEVAA